MVVTALPTMDRDLLGALKGVARKVLMELGELSPGRELSDDALVSLYARIADVMTKPGLDSKTVSWAVAFELLWPKRTVDLAKLANAAQAQIRPGATYEEVRVAFKAARAALSAFDLADPKTTAGRPRELRAEAEAFLSVVAGFDDGEIAAVTDPGRGGKDRVRHRVKSVVEAKAVPVVALYSAEVQGKESAALTPSTTLGGPGTSKTSTEVTSDAGTQRKGKRRQTPPTD
jgi:hypothetical protein